MRRWERLILIRGSAVLITAALVLAVPFCAHGAQEDTWDQSEDGKYWMYFYSPGSPAEDEWIEDQGKEYYVDSKGRMKTGWVTDKRDKNKYYMGEDGAKCFNMFTPDDHYVGPDGLILESFDTYRKAVKKQLERQMKDKAYKEREGALRPGFMLWDINGDGYRDVVVTDQVQSPGRVVLTAVWDPAEEELVPASEADLDGPEKSYLSYNQDSQSVWLTIAKDSGERDCFQMEDNGFRFESLWHFELEYDDWGDPLYYVNGLKCDLEEWTLALAQAGQEAGSPVTEGLLPLDPETVKQAVDCSPGEELPLWQP